MSASEKKKVPTQWDKFLENLGNCLGGRGTSSAVNAVERGNGSVVPCTISTAVVRVWKFRTADGTVHSIMLRHDHVFGSRTVELDGKRVHYSCGDGDVDLSFTLCGKPGSLTIKTQFQGLTILFTYTCMYENVEIPPTAAFNADNSTLDRYAICLPKYKVIEDVVHYKIVCERSGSKCPSVVWRTYDDFSSLHFDVSSAFTSTKMTEKLPELPMDTATSVMFEPIDEDDIECTRKGLEAFLVRLRSLPTTGSNPDLLRFLGIRQFVHQNAKTSTCAVNAMKEFRAGTDGGASSEKKHAKTLKAKFASSDDAGASKSGEGYDFEGAEVTREPFPVAAFVGSSSTQRRGDRTTKENVRAGRDGDTGDRGTAPFPSSSDAAPGPKISSTPITATRPLQEDDDGLIDDI